MSIEHKGGSHEAPGTAQHASGSDNLAGNLAGDGMASFSPVDPTPYVGVDGLRAVIAGVLRDFDEVRNIRPIADALIGAIALPTQQKDEQLANPEILAELSEIQIEAVISLVEQRLCIIWAKLGAREEFANELRVLQAPRDERECCMYCEEAFHDGDLVYWDVNDSGHMHAKCCGPERECYVNADGEPLKDNEPIPAPFAWKAGQ